jgi:hypothetical protein
MGVNQLAEISAGIKGVYPNRARPIPTRFAQRAATVALIGVTSTGGEAASNARSIPASTLADINVRSRGVLQKWI